MRPGTMSQEKFLDEAEVMKKLQHTRLVTLYAVCTKDEPIYIVTELMRGGSLLALLRSNLKKKQKISTDVMIDMAAQVCCFGNHVGLLVKRSGGREILRKLSLCYIVVY